MRLVLRYPRRYWRCSACGEKVTASTTSCTVADYEHRYDPAYAVPATSKRTWCIAKAIITFRLDEHVSLHR